MQSAARSCVAGKIVGGNSVNNLYASPVDRYQNKSKKMGCSKKIQLCQEGLLYQKAGFFCASGGFCISVLSVEHLCVDARLGKSKSHIVKDLTFAVAEGERLAIVGESGCGKTMTAMSLFGLLPQNCTARGTVLLDGQELLTLPQKAMRKLRGKSLVLIPQSGADFLNPVLHIGTQMGETLRKNGVRGANIQREACALLARVGFSQAEEVLGKYPFQLSGGMAQRVILAIGLACSPRLVVADEPTRGIDDETSALYLAQLSSMFQQSAVVLITHNIAVARRCQNLLVMYAGELMEYGNSAGILDHPTHPYTKSLIEALPENGFRVSDAALHYCRAHAACGCPFHHRCAQAQQRCSHENPPLQQIGGVMRRCFYAGG